MSYPQVSAYPSDKFGENLRFTGSGKSYLGCAVAKQACQHRIRAHYIRMPDLEEAWAVAKDKPVGTTKLLKKYAAFTLNSEMSDLRGGTCIILCSK